MPRLRLLTLLREKYILIIQGVAGYPLAASQRKGKPNED